MVERVKVQWLAVLAGLDVWWLLPGDGPNGYDAAVEAEEGPESLRTWGESQLEGEPDLKAVFRCLWEGERRTREIAQRLGKTEREVWLARWRLRTRLERLRKMGEGRQIC